ncbi:MAG: hypothetical protein GF416_06065 [Candidatus Altiarchaeales archaeon]|nr:hypothetical protein [Candidatus Altiarchaeales archaeon]MBD3416681.1 hypothetical protein [Candidatus Altiarchaeales archaeon]
MMDDRLRKGFTLIAVVLAPHVLLGFYALYDGGFYVYGLTAPERYAVHAISGSETRISLSGASKHVSSDICVKRCQKCPLECYPVDILLVECGGQCSLKTVGGDVLSSEGVPLPIVMKKGLVFEDAVFRCYDLQCGFDIRMDENRTYSSFLPEEIPVSW